MNIKKTLFIFAIVGALLALLSIVLLKTNGAISSLFAYCSSTLIMFASFYSFYQKSKNVDPEIYIENDEDDEEKEALNELTEAQEEKPEYKKKRFSIKNFVLGGSLFFSLYRLFAYGFFIIGFFVLLRHGYFDLTGFISGVAVSTLAVLILLFVSQKEFKA